MLFKSYDFHGKNCSDCGLLGCDMLSDRYIPSSKVNVNKEKNAVQLYRQAAKNLVNHTVTHRKIKKLTYKCH
jgi:hypothetical protein